MSNSKSSVSWRLNGLLRARQKAKAFAATSWENPGDSNQSSPFTKWQPQVLGGTGEDIDSQILDGQASSTENDLSGDGNPQQPTAEELLAEQQRQEQEITEAAHQQAVREAFEQGHQRGIEESEAKLAAARASFDELTQSIRAAQQDTTSFYDPLKKLALHLAEQLVRGELAQSSTVIERLVAEALKDVEQQGEAPIILYLSPDDRDKFSASLDGELDSLDLRADPQLSAGSVKVTIDDSAIEDLIEHRLDSLSQGLLGQPMANTRPAFDNNFANQVEEKPLEGAVELDSVEQLEQGQELPPIAQEVDLAADFAPADKSSAEPTEIDSRVSSTPDSELTGDITADNQDQPPVSDQEAETDD